MADVQYYVDWWKGTGPERNPAIGAGRPRRPGASGPATSRPRWVDWKENNWKENVPGYTEESVLQLD
jgi:hypothetical protein